ncbi:MAG: archease [Armatimonadota bacterium]|nr:MAG: archease [Armatimonadota bacterium]
MNRPKKRDQRGFRPLEHTADRSIEAWAPTLPELFCAAAEGMFSESAKCSQVAREHEWSIQVQAASLEDLLHAWLSELLWIAERDEAVLCRFEIADLQQADEGPCRVRGAARGGPVPTDSPHTGAPVKAVTYHGLRVWQQDDLWRTRLVFDV